MNSRSQSSARVLQVMPIASSDLAPAIRELLRVTNELKEAIKSLGSADMFESLTRRQAAAFLKVHPRRLADFELLGLPSFKASKGHSYLRKDLIDFRETMLRNLRGLELKIAKPRRVKLAADHS